MSRCRETAGFLISHPCPHPAAHICTQCSKPICPDHRRESLCVSCYRSQPHEGAENDPYLAGAHYYSDYNDLSSYDAYSQRERSSLDSPSSAGDEEEEWDKDWEADFDGT